MRKLLYLFLGLFLLSLGSAFALDGAEDTTLLEGLRADENYSTLLGLLEQTNLIDSLSGAGPITLFAPDNAAFDALREQGISLPTDSAQLEPILLGHVVEGVYTVNELQDAEAGSIVSMQGEPLTIDLTAAGLTVNDVSLTATDVDNVFSNGVIHGVDSVIMPASMMPADEQDTGDADATATDTTPSTDSSENADATDTNTTDTNATDTSDMTDENANATDATDETAATDVPVTNADVPNDLGTSGVRVIHLAPNVSDVSVNFVPAADTAMSGTSEVTGLGYEMVTDPVELNSDTYTVQLMANDATVLEQDMSFAPGVNYTLAVIGLNLPDENAQADDSNDGFFDFIQNLFTGDRSRDSLALNLMSLEDNVDIAPVDGETLVRVVHASPGTEAVDLVSSMDGERNVVIGDLSYGEASRYISSTQFGSDLAITVADSDAVALDLSAMSLEPNTVNTIFIAGTSLEQAPLKALLVSGEPLMSPTAMTAMPNTVFGTVATVVVNEPSLSTLAAALEEADMLAELDGTGPITLLAPSADAFAALSQDQLDALLADKETLTRVLNNHIIEGAIYSDDALSAGTVTSLDGTNFDITDTQGLQISDATVTNPDIQATNGVVQVIDTLLIPEGVDLNTLN